MPPGTEAAGAAAAGLVELPPLSLSARQFVALSFHEFKARGRSGGSAPGWCSSFCSFCRIFREVLACVWLSFMAIR